MDWAVLDYEKIANALVVLIVGLAAGLGIRSGKKSGSPALPLDDQPRLEFAGALIDSSSAKQLAAAIEALTMESINRRKSSERDTEKIVNAIEDLTREADGLKMVLALKN